MDGPVFEGTEEGRKELSWLGAGIEGCGDGGGDEVGETGEVVRSRKGRER